LVEEVKKKVAYYIKKYQTNNPFRLATALGIEVAVGDIGSRAGCYMYLKRTKCIWINENLEGNERLFVMAHELGHAILHPRQNCYFIRHKTLFLNSKVEQEANQFAINLLIPDDILAEYLMYQEYTLDQLSRLLGYEKRLIELRLKSTNEKGQTLI
jgi:Zn-dependent peptidase ImmA (M78 family)